MNIHQLRPQCEYFSFYPYYLPSAYCVTKYMDKKPSFPQPNNDKIDRHETINKSFFIVLIVLILFFYLVF